MKRAAAHQQRQRLLASHLALPGGGSLIDVGSQDVLLAEAVVSDDPGASALVTCSDLRSCRDATEAAEALGGRVAVELSDGSDGVDDDGWDAVALAISSHLPPISADRLIFEAALRVDADGALWLATSNKAGKRARGTAEAAFGPSEKVGAAGGQRVDRYGMRDRQERLSELHARAAELAEEERTQVWLEVGGTRLQLETRVGVFAYRAIDPGTRLLLDWALQQPGARRILDVGCGYGAIGLAAAATWPDARVDMVDVDLRSVRLAEANVPLNGLANCSVSLADAAVDLPEGRYDLALSNLPAHEGRGPSLDLLRGVQRTLRPSGRLVAVVPMDSGLREFAVEVFGPVQAVVQSGSHEVFVTADDG